MGEALKEKVSLVKAAFLQFIFDRLMRVLLVEDNKSIATNIQKYLELEHFRVDVSCDGEEGLQKAKTGSYDIILLDIMLPKLNGIQVCQKIRTKSEVPIIMLTAKWQLEDKVEGFGCGADDYLVKPKNFTS